MSPIHFPTTMATTPQRQHGISLVEIMIAITLGLVLMTGVIQFFIGNKQAYKMQQSINGLQENGRYALRQITDSLRMADHWGGVDGADINGSPIVTGTGGCDAAWILNIGEGLLGYEGAANSPLPAGCIDNADYVADSDAFVVRHAGGNFFTSANASSGTNASGIWLRVAVGRRGRLFRGADITSLPADLYNAADADAVGLYNYPYRISVYFIRPCSAKAGTACTATDDGGRPVPTLTSLTLVGDQLIEQPLANGVEQMQLEYGVDANLDTNVEFYATAAQVTAANQWNRIASIRVSLIVRADERSKILDTNNYTLPSGYVFTPVGDAQRYQRKIFTSVVQIRNRSRF